MVQIGREVEEWDIEPEPLIQPAEEPTEEAEEEAIPTEEVEEPIEVWT